MDRIPPEAMATRARARDGAQTDDYGSVDTIGWYAYVIGDNGIGYIVTSDES